MSWLRTLDQTASPSRLPFEHGIWSGLRSYGARLLLLGLAIVVGLGLTAALAIFFRVMRAVGT